MGSEGELNFSVFDEIPIGFTQGNSREFFTIENPKNIQLYHVGDIYQQLVNRQQHPSNGSSALHTSWVMDKILAVN